MLGGASSTPQPIPHLSLSRPAIRQRSLWHQSVLSPRAGQSSSPALAHGQDGGGARPAGSFVVPSPQVYSSCACTRPSAWDNPLLAMHYDFESPTQRARPIFHAQMGTSHFSPNELRDLDFRASIQPPKATLYSNIRIPTPNAYPGVPGPQNLR
jgi:hypothetical protein